MLAQIFVRDLNRMSFILPFRFVRIVLLWDPIIL